MDPLSKIQNLTIADIHTFDSDMLNFNLGIFRALSKEAK
jgi:hypothetical protein